MKEKLYWVSWLVQIFRWHRLALISSILQMKLVVSSLLKLVREHICKHWVVLHKLGLVLTKRFSYLSLLVMSFDSCHVQMIIQVHVCDIDNPEEASFFESFEAAHSSHDLSSSIAKVMLFL